jgi:hypothetical protein
VSNIINSEHHAVGLYSRIRKSNPHYDYQVLRRHPAQVSGAMQHIEPPKNLVSVGPTDAADQPITQRRTSALIEFPVTLSFSRFSQTRRGRSAPHDAWTYLIW